MAPTVLKTVNVKTAQNVIQGKERASAKRVGLGHIVIRRVRQGHLARTVATPVHVNPTMLRDVVISRLENVFANLVIQEIGVLCQINLTNFVKPAVHESSWLNRHARS
jgi:hypothetical protein